MNRSIRQFFMIFLSFALLLSAWPVTFAANDTAPNGEYTVHYSYYKDNTNSTSVINDYTVGNTGKLVIENGTAIFTHTVSMPSAFVFFGALDQGAARITIVNSSVAPATTTGYTEVTITPIEGSDDQALVSIPIADIYARQEIMLHIVIPSADYNNWYNLQLQLDVSSIGTGNEGSPGSEVGDVTFEQFEELLSDAQALLTSTEAGTGDGYYRAEARTAFEDAIQQAIALAGSGNNNQLVKAAYIILDEATKAYQLAKITVNKAILLQTLNEVSEFLDSAKVVGSTVGGVGIISDGEYDSTSINFWITQAYNSANSVALNPQATQIQVNNALESLAATMNTYKLDYYTASEIPLLILDPDTMEESQYKNDFENLGTVFEIANPNKFSSSLNVTFKEVQTVSEFKAYNNTKNGDFNGNMLGATAREIPTISNEGGEEAPSRYQIVTARHPEANDDVYQGLVKVRYTIGEADDLETREVLFSLNANHLEQLKQEVEAAWEVHGNAEVGNENGQHSEASIDALEAAIQQAEAVSNVIGSTRPEISTSSLQLQNALTRFANEAAKEIHFTALHATNLAASSMNSYFIKPALVHSTEDGFDVSFTIKDSSIITSFKTEYEGQMIESEEVSSNTESDTRIVQFRIKNLTDILPAEVSIYDPTRIDQSTNQPYQATHNIRLAWDTGDHNELQAAIAEAEAKWGTATVGSAAGQYPQEAKDELEEAITEAKAVNSDILATQQQLNEAKEALTDNLIEFYTNKNWSNAVYPIEVETSGSDFSSFVSQGSVLINGEIKKLGLLPTAGASIKFLESLDNHSEIEAEEASDGYYEFALSDLSVPYTLVIESGEETYQFTFYLAGITAGGNNLPGNPSTPTPGNPVYPADGKYHMPFTIYKQGTTSASVAHSYVVPNALVTVSGGTKTVAFTVLQSNEITGMKINGSSGSIVSMDTAKNQRVVSFTLSDLSSTLNGWVKVDWPAVNYHHEYDIQFKFHETQASYVGENGTVPTAGSNPGAPNLPNPDDDSEAAEEDGEEESTEAGGDEVEAETGTDNNDIPVVQFTDTASHWAKASIEKAVKLGIVNGYADGNFRPNGTVTRGEFAVMLSRALKLEGSGTSSLTDEASIPNWAKEHVAKVVAAGIITGYADGSFRSGDQLTRAQLAVMIARAANLNVDEAATLQFADAAQIPAWAQKEVAAAVKAGLIQGKGNNRFDASGTATRAEALTLIIRLLEQDSE